MPRSSREAIVSNISPRAKPRGAFPLLSHTANQSVLGAHQTQAAPAADRNLLAFRFTVQAEAFAKVPGPDRAARHAMALDLPQALQNQQHQKRQPRKSVARAGTAPRIERAEKRSDVIERTRYELQPVKPSRKSTSLARFSWALSSNPWIAQAAPASETPVTNRPTSKS